MNVIYFLIFYIEFRLDFALRSKPSKMKFIDQLAASCFSPV